MTIKRRINYSDNTQITAIKKQTNDSYLWVAYDQNSDGVCILEKQWGFSPDQTFFSLEKQVTKIVKMDCNSTLLFVAYQDDSLLGEILTLNNPLSDNAEIDIPSGISEYPIDVKVDGSDLWFLLPGIISGSNTKLLRYQLDGDFVETIDLDQSGKVVTDASSMVIDSNGDIQILTNTSPATTVRVYELSGGGFDYDIQEYA